MLGRLNSEAAWHFAVSRRQILRLLDHCEQFEGLGFWAAEEKATGRFLGWFHSRALIRKGFTEVGMERVVAETDIAVGQFLHIQFVAMRGSVRH